MMQNSENDPDKPDDAGDDEVPMHGQVQHKNLSARLPEHVGAGVFSNGVLILTGPFEVVLDFVLRMGEQQRIASRIVMPHGVARQFLAALTENVSNYEKRFGLLPKMPKPLPEPENSPEWNPEEGIASAQHPAPEGSTPQPGIPDHPENRPAKPVNPPIEEIYHELRLPDDLLSGRYANAVLIRHSGTEFCFDFITNLYPRSAISARVFLAAPHVGPFLSSLGRSLGN